MSVLNKEDLIANLKQRLGEDTSDEALGILEDVSDTMNDLETRLSSNGDWKTKYEENDAEWRKKYSDRFLNPPQQEETEKHENDMDVPKRTLTYEELFKED